MLVLAYSCASACLLCLQFVQILFALELFLLSPFVRRSIRGASNTAHIGVTIAVLGATVLLVSFLSLVAASILVISVLLISFICPVFLTRLHRFKAKIGGPWVSCAQLESAWVYVCWPGMFRACCWLLASLCFDCRTQDEASPVIPTDMLVKPSSKP